MRRSAKLKQLKMLLLNTIVDLEESPDTSEYARGRKDAYKIVVELLESLEKEEAYEKKLCRIEGGGET